MNFIDCRERGAPILLSLAKPHTLVPKNNWRAGFLFSFPFLRGGDRALLPWTGTSCGRLWASSVRVTTMPWTGTGWDGAVEGWGTLWQLP